MNKNEAHLRHWANSFQESREFLRSLPGENIYREKLIRELECKINQIEEEIHGLRP